MTQHEQATRVRVVESYDADTLGTPFKVTLKNSVTVTIDSETGDKIVEVPDLVGLIAAVIRSRVVDPRKLSGEEIRFLRRALGVQAKKLAAFLELAPEHFSRCESGNRTLSASAEKQLRLFAFGGSLYSNPEELLVRSGDHAQLKQMSEDDEKKAYDFFRIFLDMRIEPCRDANEVIEYVFTRRRRKGRNDADGDNGDWVPPVADAA